MERIRLRGTLGPGDEDYEAGDPLKESGVIVGSIISFNKETREFEVEVTDKEMIRKIREEDYDQ